MKKRLKRYALGVFFWKYSEGSASTNAFCIEKCRLEGSICF
ncbi:hypothetical protein QFZ72_004835 [Bacillus sp. V2I10]|nr:hypothetical protein [Bacillus sp. V2I10]